jgi:hypothetical protein
MYTLLITTNKFTGKTSYYAKDDNKLNSSFKRTTKEQYNWLELLHKRWDCMHSNSDAKYSRQYKTISN